MGAYNSVLTWRGEKTDSAEMLEVLVGDFLADLKSRPNVHFG